MSDWFETTGDSYFKHINRTTIELAVAAARGGIVGESRRQIEQ
ncbi:hypothetical protein [Sinorhizobium medicae]